MYQPSLTTMNHYSIKPYPCREVGRRFGRAWFLCGAQTDPCGWRLRTQEQPTSACGRHGGRGCAQVTWLRGVAVDRPSDGWYPAGWRRPFESPMKPPWSNGRLEDGTASRPSTRRRCGPITRRPSGAGSILNIPQLASGDSQKPT